MGAFWLLSLGFHCEPSFSFVRSTSLEEWSFSVLDAYGSEFTALPAGYRALYVVKCNMHLPALLTAWNCVWVYCTALHCTTQSCSGPNFVGPVFCNLVADCFVWPVRYCTGLNWDSTLKCIAHCKSFIALNPSMQAVQNTFGVEESLTYNYMKTVSLTLTWRESHLHLH